ANPVQIATSGTHTWYTGSDNDQCWSCHVSTGTAPKDFHQDTLVKPACTSCHYNYSYMSDRGRPDRYVNSTMYNSSVHWNVSCSNCHTKGHNNIGARKACEDCHAVQSDPVNDKSRHNITDRPSSYTIGGVPVVGITSCTTCHSSSLYNNATSTYSSSAAKDCDYCHTYPDKNREYFY
ncbi:MAG TPA: hypothetical protein HA257_05800, partial [Candidatus Methanoperedenaceae archaeon]|nr:hypothetical protein [Candidatus Methanoperedenaceae archaeon]